MNLLNLESASAVSAAMAFGEISLPVKMPADEYHAVDALNHSTLSRMRWNPRKVKHGGGFKPTPAMELGTAIHSAVLEPDDFDATYAVAPSIDRRTKAGKQEYADWLDANAGRTPLAKSDFELCRRVQSTMGEPFFRNLFGDGFAELSWFAKTQCGSVWRKSRSDWWNPKSHALIDVKTTKDARINSFRRSIRDFAYVPQLAWYSDMIELVMGEPPRDVFIVAIETAFDGDAIVYRISDDDLDAGRMRYRRWLNQWLNCKTFNDWCGYARYVRDFQQFDWEKDDADV